ncbi:MAG: sensor histidine kinase [Proteobacteria bacterium]|nr:MAG: sensor histidine kinase [Pseudomonadota bacterium]
MAPHEARMFEGIARVAAQALPPADAPAEAFAPALREIGDALLADVALFDAAGALVAAAGTPLSGEELARARAGELHGHAAYWMRFALPDGRELVARHAYQHGHWVEIGGMAALLAALVALGAYPLVRRLTRRLERLRARVEALGAGDLGARVDVEGRDEVAALARSFNGAAARIERLVEAQRTLLAGVSHELRTPLARIRVAAELATDGARPELAAEIERSVAELDEGIGELLLASRLDAQPLLAQSEPVDLLALAAEEAARTGAQVRGEPLSVAGDARMLRRLVRNLLENACRHGDASCVEIAVAREGGRSLVRVDDCGPGVPDAERERIFEPFYRPAASQETAGLGLGLALVRRIARHHGGDARCLARPGGGTRFEVVL